MATHSFGKRAPWWSSPYYVTVMCLLMAVPLLWPDFPPLSDVPTHLSRFRIQAGTEGASTLAQTYFIRWIPVGNLGTDILVFLIQPLVGVELAAKIVITAIPVLAAAGMFLIVKEAHGQVPPTAAFALPFAYGYPFQYGFVNFSLSVALVLLSLGVMLRLRRKGPGLARTVFLLVAGVAIYFSHVMGWMIFGMVCAGEALAYRWKGRDPFLRTLVRAFFDCLPAALPLILILLWRSGDSGGETSGWFDLNDKWGWIQSALRERWKQWDGNSVYVVILVIFGALVAGFRWNRSLGLVTVMLGLFYLVIPYAFFGLIYADMRVAPLLLAVAVLAMTPPRSWSPRVLSLIAIAATLFAVARLGGSTAAMAAYAKEQQPYLDTLTSVPRGSRVVVLANLPCPRGWAYIRLPSSLATVRRDAFVNDQFRMPGSQLLWIGPAIPEAFAYGDSASIRLPGCDRKEPLLEEALARIPRQAFDYIWLMEVPETNLPRDPGLRLIRRVGGSALYRIEKK